MILTFETIITKVRKVNNILIADEILPLTSLTDEWCNNYSINSEEDELNLKPVPNASVYEVKFTDIESGMPQVINLSQTTFTLDTFGLLPHLTYNVRARANANGNWSEWGKSCEIAFESNDSTAFKLNLLLYPNPASNSEDINMYIKGDWNNLEILICNLEGQILFREITDIKDRENHILQLTESLNAGMYLIHIRNNFENLTKKLIIE